MHLITHSCLETERLGKKIAAKLKGGEVLCLYGELGAGKTTFMHGLIGYFLPGKRVVSPTFVIVRHYELSGADVKFIYHIDLYRLEKQSEIQNVGLTEQFGKSDTIIAIEWAQKLGELIPDKRIDVSFQIVSEHTREIRVKKYE